MGGQLGTHRLGSFILAAAEEDDVEGRSLREGGREEEAGLLVALCPVDGWREGRREG